MSYFLENYDGLTLFLKNPSLPIDNNQQERLLRNPVVGRKTWYGTHSKRGAQIWQQSCSRWLNPANSTKLTQEYILKI